MAQSEIMIIPVKYKIFRPQQTFPHIVHGDARGDLALLEKIRGRLRFHCVLFNLRIELIACVRAFLVQTKTLQRHGQVATGRRELLLEAISP